MKKLVLTLIVSMITLGLAHGAALGDSYDTFVQALKRPGEPIKQVNPFFNQSGWRIWPGQNSQVADIYCNFENERAQAVIYRFRVESKGAFHENEIWRILAFYSSSPWYEERGNVRGRIFVTNDLRESAFLTANNTVLSIVYNTWMIRHYPAKRTEQVAKQTHRHSPPQQPRMDQLPIERLVPELDIFAATEVITHGK